MKKKMNVILLMFAVVAMMTACGTKDTVDADANKPVKEEVSVENPTVTPEAADSEPAAPVIPVVNDKIDRIVNVDIPVGNQAEKVDLPELHMYVTGDAKEQVSANCTRYEIPNETISLEICAAFTDVQCQEYYTVPHYETTNLGRYAIDVDYQENISYGATYITVYDTQVGGGVQIEIAINSTTEEAPTDDQRAYVKQYALMEAEYIKKQVTAWSQDFVPGSGAEISATAPVEANTEDKVYVLDKYPDITVTLSYSSDGTVAMTATSPSDATIQCNLVKTEDGKLQACGEGGEMFMEITVNDGKISVNTPFMEYANYFGEYSLK